MSVGRCAFKVSYFSVSFPRSRNSEKNPALQRSAMSQFTTYRSAGAEASIVSSIYRHIAPLEQRGFNFMC